MFPPAGLHTIAGHFRIWVVKHSSQTNRPFAQQRSAAGCWTVSLLTATMDMQLHADFHNSGMRSSKAIDEHLNPRQSLSLLTSCTPTFTIRECGMTSLAYDRSKASILLASHLWIPWRLAKRTEGSSFSFLWCLLLLLLFSSPHYTKRSPHASSKAAINHACKLLNFVVSHNRGRGRFFSLF